MTPFWFPIRGGETLQKTAALAPSALGCWLLLRIYLLETPRLPTRKKELLRLCRGAEWPDVLAALTLLAVDEAGYKFCEEIERVKCQMSKTSEKRKEAGKKGAESRWRSKSRLAKPENTQIRVSRI